MSGEASNFGFLAVHDVRLVKLGTLAERYFRDDPNTAIIKLRQFAEEIAQLLAAQLNLYTSPEEPQVELLRRLKFEGGLPREVLDLFHQLRVSGNRAVHAHADDHKLALESLKIARQLAIWFHRTLSGDKTFRPGPFQPPASPEDASSRLREEIEELQAERARLLSDTERAREEAQQAALAREGAEARAAREAEERGLWAELAQEAEREKGALLEKLAGIQAQAQAAPAAQRAAIIERAEEAAQEIDLDEAATRAIIDQKLRDRGWEVDSETLRYANGTRPATGRAMAIAEWPTESGPADYAFFIGTKCIAVVEAKRKRKNVSAAIDQAERYSKGIKLDGAAAQAIGGPWGEFRVPFVFASNGRPYLKQLETQSGIWFRDVRHDTNLRRALEPLRVLRRLG